MIIDVQDKDYQEVVQIRHEIHQNPELGHTEVQTTKVIRDYLEKIGVEILPYPLKTGVAAIIRGNKPGKCLAIREDIDALPILEETGLPYASKKKGISHACGHDVHTTLLLLTAKKLNDQKMRLNGSVLFLFQPAEETFDGAVEMMESGVLKDFCPNEIIGLHCAPAIPLGKFGVISGYNNASCDVLSICIHGKGGHGAHPEDCVDPIMAAAMLITQIQTLISRELSPQEAAVLTFGEMKAGTAPNIIPSEAVIKGTLRALNPAIRNYLLDAIPRLCTECCRAMRAEAAVVFEKGMPPLVNDCETAERLTKTLEECYGNDTVIRLKTPSMGSDDFSCMLEACNGRGGQFLLGTNDGKNQQTGMGLHKAENIFPDEAIAVGASALTEYAKRYLV